MHQLLPFLCMFLWNIVFITLFFIRSPTILGLVVTNVASFVFLKRLLSLCWVLMIELQVIEYRLYFLFNALNILFYSFLVCKLSYGKLRIFPLDILSSLFCFSILSFWLLCVLDIVLFDSIIFGILWVSWRCADAFLQRLVFGNYVFHQPFFPFLQFPLL